MSKFFSSAAPLAATLFCTAAHAAQRDANASQPQVSATQNLPSAAAIQQAHGLTRAQVYAQLIQLEQVGYDPNGSHFTYPAKTQAAEARLAAGTDNARDANSAAHP
jgi:hypothetical protein